MQSRIGVGIFVALLTVAGAAGCGGSQSKDTSNTLENTAPAQTTAEATPAAEAAPVASQLVGPRQVPISDAQAAAPAPVLATAAVADPSAQVAALSHYGGLIDASMGAYLGGDFLDQMVGNLVGLPTIAGLDYAKPLRAVILDPEQADMPVVMVAAVADERALDAALPSSGEVVARVHRGYAAIGTLPSLQLAAPYALTTLQAQPAPSAPTLTIDVPKLLSSFGDELAGFASLIEHQAANDPSMASGKLVLDKLLGLMQQSERMLLRLDVDGGAATVEMALQPRANSDLATLLAGQTPSAFSLAASVPSGWFLCAGQFSETLNESLQEFNRASMRTFYDQATTDQIMAAMSEWQKLASGEFALSGSQSPTGGMHMNGLWKVTDANKARRLITKQLARLPPKLTLANGLELRVKHNRKALRYRGLTAHGLRMSIRDLDKLPQNERATMEKTFGKTGLSILVAVGNQHAAMATGPDKQAAQTMRALIDTTRDKKQPAPDPAVAALIDEARARKESVFFALDMASLAASVNPTLSAGASQWLPFGVGFADGALTARITVQASSIRALIAMARTP